MAKLARHFVPNFGVLLILGLFLLVQSVTGSPPVPILNQSPSALLISYQGQLADANGNPLTGDYQMQFALYDVSTGEGTGPGPNGSCWSETQTVSVSDGFFNVLLGSVNAIDPACLTGDVYLGITVGNDSEMTPRELLTSVPHAVQASMVPNGSITADKLNLVDGNVGIGISNPSTKLEVAGQIRTVNASSHGLYSRSQAVGYWGGVFVNNYGGTEREVDLAGSTYAAIFKNGNVGIGTTSPDTTLDVNGDATFAGGDIGLTGDHPAGHEWSAVDYNIYASSGGTLGFHATSGGLNLRTDASLFVDGRVGIGTADPGSLLHVKGSSPTLTIENSNGGYSEITQDANGDFKIGRVGTGGWDMGVQADGDTYLGMHGNVGVGTTDPGSKLDVAGDVSIHNRINLRRNGYYAEIEANSAGGGSGATRLYFYGYDASENRNLTAMFDGNGHARFYGNAAVDGELAVAGNGTSKIEGNLQVGRNDWTPEFAGMDGNDLAVEGQFEQAGSGGARFWKIGIGMDPDSDVGTLALSKHVKTPKVASPQDFDLVIDAGLGSHNTLTLHDDVDIHDGDLKVGNNHKVFTAWLGSEAGSDLTIDAGFNSDNKIRLTDHLDLQNYNIERVNELWVNSAHCNTCTTGALVEANLQADEELASERIDRFAQGDLQCWSTQTERLEKCTAANDRLVQSVADTDGRPIVLGAEPVKVIGPVKAGDLLVSSSVPGYAMVNNNPAPGTVIAQALEDFNGEKGMIKAMIRKF